MLFLNNCICKKKTNIESSDQITTYTITTNMMSMKISAYLGGEDEDNETYDGDHSFYMAYDNDVELKNEEAAREDVTLCTWKQINAGRTIQIGSKT